MGLGLRLGDVVVAVVPVGLGVVVAVGDVVVVVGVLLFIFSLLVVTFGVMVSVISSLFFRYSIYSSVSLSRRGFCMSEAFAGVVVVDCDCDCEDSLTHNCCWLCCGVIVGVGIAGNIRGVSA